MRQQGIRPPSSYRLRWLLGGVGSTWLLAAVPALAFPIDTDHPELKLSWDTTLKYSAAWRTQGRSATLIANPGLDDGDRNFGTGLISNRIDLLSEMDLRYQRLGARVSVAAWYDTVYRRGNDNDSFGTLGGPFPTTNHTGAFNQFPAATRDLHGSKAEVLDAFVFAGFDLGEMRGNARLGRHTVLYGESLFLGANGIAAAQAPIDIVKALSVPGTQFKELMRPVPQLSGTLQLSESLSLGAYYQFRWEANRIPGAGSYFSFADNTGAGAERLLPVAIAPPGSDGIVRQADRRARNSGQWGMQLRLRAAEADFGFYAVRYHAKDFEQYLQLVATGAPPPNSPVAPASYQLVYAEGIKAFGLSASQTFGDVNVAAELSTRRDTPMLSSVTLGPGQMADNAGSPGYAVGNSAHAQVSVIWQLPKTVLFNEGTFAGELAWNRALSVTKNAAAIDPNTTRDAWALRFVLTPVFRQAMDGVDLELPIGLGYNPDGRSRVVPLFNAPASSKGGDFSLGLNVAYLDRWRFGLSATHFFGSAGTFLDADNHRSFKQHYRDRDFLSLTARSTF